MTKMIVALIAVLATTFVFAAPPRVGIQMNLPVYVRAGVITQSEADAIQQRINRGELRETFVHAGTRGRNYWVTTEGELRSKDYIVESLDMNEDMVRGRYARTDGCHIWFGGDRSRRGCDNLFVPYQRPPTPKPPEKPVSPPPAPPETPCDTVVPIPPSKPAPPPPPPPTPAPALPCITPVGLAPRCQPIPAGEECVPPPCIETTPLAFGKSALVAGQLPYTITGEREEVRLDYFRWSARERQRQRTCPPPPCPPPQPPPGPYCPPIPPVQIGPDGEHPLNPPPAWAD